MTQKAKNLSPAEAHYLAGVYTSEEGLPKCGYVIIYLGHVCGWTRSDAALLRSRVKEFAPNAWAVPVKGGDILVTRGGDADAGAERWESLMTPDSVAPATSGLQALLPPSPSQPQHPNPAEAQRTPPVAAAVASSLPLPAGAPAAESFPPQA